MKPTMRLRIYSEITQVTAEMVLAESERTDDPMPVCKKRLQAATQSQHQQWHEAEVGDPEEIRSKGGIWLPIEHVVHVRNAPSVEPDEAPQRARGPRP